MLIDTEFASTLTVTTKTASVSLSPPPVEIALIALTNQVGKLKFAFISPLVRIALAIEVSSVSVTK